MLVCMAINDEKLWSALNDLEDQMAENNDRDVEEYRDYYPENVVAIDILRDLVKAHAIPEDSVNTYIERIKKVIR
jgi:hypothetical protein